MLEFAFSKYSGCGNDFILIDNRHSAFPAHNSSVIARLCRRPDGIGADGIVLLENSQKADFKMRIFNADGSEAEMCGNGIRCLNCFIQELGIQAPAFEIETIERQLRIEAIGDAVKASMGDPKEIKLNVTLPIDDQQIVVHHINTGVPHAIHFVDDIAIAPIQELGRKIRFHTLLQPRGANANFVQITGPSSLLVRTYERGVEQETLACGTGATASAIVAYLQYNLKAPLQVQTRSGQALIIDFAIDENKKITNVTQSGPAMYHFKGSFALSKEDLCH